MKIKPALIAEKLTMNKKNEQTKKFRKIVVDHTQNIQTHRHTDTQTNRHTHTHTYTHTHTHVQDSCFISIDKAFL